MDLERHLTRQIEWSRKTFGPGARKEGVLDHIAKEVEEVRAAGRTTVEEAEEWVDIVILALDGLTRSLGQEELSTSADVAYMAVRMIRFKQARNEARTWPDWRTQPADKAIEHDRTNGV